MERRTGMGMKRGEGRTKGSGTETVARGLADEGRRGRSRGDPFPVDERGDWVRDASKEDIVKIIDNAPCGIVINRRPLGKVLYINRKSLEMTGYTVSEVPTGQAAARTFALDIRHRRDIKKDIKTLIAEGASLSLAAGVMCKDGTTKIFEINGVILKNGMAVSMWTDVTRREEAEAKVRESEARFRSFFEESAEAILLFDGDTIIDCNPAALRMLSCSEREQAMSLSFSGISPERQADGRLSARKLKSAMITAMRKKSHRFEWVLMRCDGNQFPAEVTMTVIKLKGRPVFYVTLRDITAWKEAAEGLLMSKRELEVRVKERTWELSALNKRLLNEIETRKSIEKEVERSREELRYLSEHLQRAREDERTRIAREVHDELGQSLSALKIDVTCLGNSEAEPCLSLQEQTKSMEVRIDGAINVVRNICSELRPPVLDHFGLPAAVEWYLQDFEKRTGIACSAVIDPSFPAPDKGLALMLFRILQEAMTNILRHAAAGKVKVSLKKEARYFVLRVDDDGKGISKEDAANPRSFGIIGIQERVRFWGGKSLFKGRPGKGTTMTVLIPVAPQRQRSSRNISGEGKAGGVR
jgi:PAS domain S-box-containing protein